MTHFSQTSKASPRKSLYIQSILKTSASDNVVLGFYLTLLAAMCAYLFWKVRYLARARRTRNWPRASASIQRGAIGRISFGKAGAPAAFFGYTFVVNGQPFAGMFAVYGDENKIQSFYDRLPGTSVEIQYSPWKPAISYLYGDPSFESKYSSSGPTTSPLTEIGNAKFGAVQVTQDPEYLNQAPPFDLAEAMRGAKRV